MDPCRPDEQHHRDVVGNANARTAEDRAGVGLRVIDERRDGIEQSASEVALWNQTTVMLVPRRARFRRFRLT
jgi:hypothetical protein